MPTCAMAHSFTRQLINSLTYKLINSLTHKLTNFPTQYMTTKPVQHPRNAPHTSLHVMGCAFFAHAAAYCRGVVLALCIAFVCAESVWAQKADTLSVVFTGDVLLDRGVRKRIEYLG